MKHQNRGFTLIELSIVMAIIALLVAVVVPNWVAEVEISKKNICLANVRVLQGLLDLAQQDSQASHTPIDITNLSYDGIAGIVCPNYLAHMPACPAGGANYYTDNNGDVICSFHR